MSIFNNRKILFSIVFVLFLVGGIVAFYLYSMIYSPNISHDIGESELFIPSNSPFEDVKSLLQKKEILQNEKSFVWVAKKMNYSDRNVKSGRYLIKSGISNYELIQLLRSGSQTPVRLVINQARMVDELLGQVSKVIEADSLSLIDKINDPGFLSDIGYTKENLMSLFIPNSYDFFWDTQAEQFFERMISEHKKFWASQKRIDALKSLEMTPSEVYTLASIVEKETISNKEKPRIAGVYLNRLERGIRLQADPTVIFGLKAFGIRRVLNRHLNQDTPYNTYIHAGIPPGPICLTSISSIDAVLNYENHKFLYFCAKPESNGEHLFAENLSQHLANARKFQSWLDSRGIRE